MYTLLMRCMTSALKSFFASSFSFGSGPSYFVDSKFMVMTYCFNIAIVSRNRIVRVVEMGLFVYMCACVHVHVRVYVYMCLCVIVSIRLRCQ